MKKDTSCLIKLSCFLLLIGTSIFFSPAHAGALPAFPGAEGFGSTTIGGRGGRVIKVTNLNDSGQGSLRAACEASGPRIVIFETGGTITLTKTLKVKNPYITIAGQTAPGDGIFIKGKQINIITHDVIIRGLRIGVGEGGSLDGFNIGYSLGASPYNVIIDHSSIRWSTDENIGIWSDGVKNITISNSIISEGLNVKLHSKGTLVHDTTTKVTFYKNIFAHNSARNPQFADYAEGEVINNLIYNYESGGARVQMNAKMNLIGNYFKHGNDTTTNKGVVIASPRQVSLYVRDNICTQSRPTNEGSDWLVVKGDNNETYRSRTPAIKGSGISAMLPNDAYNYVLANAGATQPKRDATDARIINDIKKGTGSIVNCVEIDGSNDVCNQANEVVGDWPYYAKGTAPKDSDGDGMPDSWEKDHRLNPNNPADGNQDRNGDGYTNIEEYINGLFPDSGNSNPGADPTAPSPPANLRIITVN